MWVSNEPRMSIIIVRRSYFLVTNTFLVRKQAPTTFWHFALQSLLSSKKKKGAWQHGLYQEPTCEQENEQHVSHYANNATWVENYLRQYINKMSAVCYFAANTRALALDFHDAILKHARTKHKYVCTLLGRMYFFALHGLCDVFTARCKWACAAATQTPHTPRHTHIISRRRQQLVDSFWRHAQFARVCCWRNV